MNDKERMDWISNDEGLWNWWLTSKTPMKLFVKEHRAEIDRIIESITSGKKPSHYLAYGP